MYITHNLSKWYIFMGAAHKVLPPSVRIYEEIKVNKNMTLEQVKWRSRSNQNRRCTSISCGHCNTCMVICPKGISFAGRCTQIGTYQSGSTKKIEVKYYLGNRLCGCQGHNKIRGSHLHHVGAVYKVDL